MYVRTHYVNSITARCFTVYVDERRSVATHRALAVLRVPPFSVTRQLSVHADVTASQPSVNNREMAG